MGLIFLLLVKWARGACNCSLKNVCLFLQDVIEPLLKPQWWVDCKQMAADGCAAVRDGRIEIIPKDFEGTWFRWLEVCSCLLSRL